MSGTSVKAAGDKLLLMHVAKTAGTSIAKSIAAALGREYFFFGFDRSYYGTFDDFESMDDVWRGWIFDRPDQIRPAKNFGAAHMALGTILEGFQGYRVMTVFREPRSRVLSLWSYWRGVPDDILRSLGSWKDVVNSSWCPLGEFIANPAVACQVDNFYARLLLWPSPLIPDDGFIPEESDETLVPLLERNLERLDFVSSLEAPDLVKRLQAWLGTDLELTKENRTQPVPPTRSSSLADELTDEALATLRLRTRLDLRVWEIACSHGSVPGPQADEVFARAIARHAVILRGA